MRADKRFSRTGAISGAKIRDSMSKMPYQVRKVPYPARILRIEMEKSVVEINCTRVRRDGRGAGRTERVDTETRLVELLTQPAVSPS